MGSLWTQLIGGLNSFGSERAIDTVVAFVVLVIALCLAWLLGRRRTSKQSSQIHALELEQLRLTAELATVLQRYDTALRGSDVTVFTQDRELRYTSISNAFLGYTVDEILDRTDDELIPAENRPDVVALKREVLESGQSKDRELQVSDGQITRWYDFHIEPIRENGRVVGLTSAVVDITASKEGEEHLRLLMREISHRSKNLLAMIQAMARQTARHTGGSVDDFLNQFNARVQALARSHDLLVQENWHGVTLQDLLNSQLSPYVDTGAAQVVIEGPPVLLKPETAQSLGLALHELASNASKFGALSIPAGRLSVRWSMLVPKTDGIEILWTESGGPTVGVPKKRGFGSMLIQQNLSRSLDSEVDLKFAEDGVNCRIRIPELHLESHGT